MSDTVVTESVPTSTTAIAQSVMDAAEPSSDPGVEVSGETPAPEGVTPPSEPEPEPAPAVEPPTPAELSAAAKFLLKQGHEARKKDGHATWLPYSTVERMLDRYLDQHSATWTGERGVIERERDTLREHLDTLRTRLAGDETEFLRELASIDPRYGRFLEAPKVERAAEPEMPLPDLPLADGSKTYSLEGLKKLLDWNTQRVEARMEAKLKPWEEREKKTQAEREREDAVAAVRERSRKQIETAQTWPNWAEYKDDVLKRLEADSAQAAKEQRRPTMTLREAYLEVKHERMSPEYGKVREKVLEDLKTAQRSPATVRSATDAPKAATRSTADIARETMARLERASNP